MKNKLINWLTLFLILFSITYVIIPLTPLDQTSSFLHDSRWWLNHYYEFKNTFPHITPVSFSAFNNSGLIINQMYPTNTLRFLEIPFILGNVSNPYVIMQGLSLITLALTGIGVYLVTKALSIKQPLFITSLFLLVLTISRSRGPINSLTQNIATALILYGVYCILQKRYIWFGLIVFCLFNTSLSSSIIAAVCFFIIIIYDKYSIKQWLTIIFSGAMGIVCSTPMLIPIFQNINKVSAPTTLFKASGRPWIIFEEIDPIIAVTLFVIPLILIGIILYTKTSHSKMMLIISSILVGISISPKISALATIPIQEGTWGRVWPLISIFILILYKNLNVLKYKYILFSIGVLIFIFNLSTLSFTQKPTREFSQAVATKNDLEISNILQKGIITKNTKYTPLQFTHAVADISPDYIPKKATLAENNDVFLPSKTIYQKYGLTKQPINHGKTLRIKVQPKQKITPLLVWYYDSIHYQITTSNGKVTHSKNNMFEYHGSKPTIITITVD